MQERRERKDGPDRDRQTKGRKTRREKIKNRKKLDEDEELTGK